MTNVSPSDCLISVVIPAYNAERTLAETLASVSAQRHAAIEILIVDDGSTDATAAIAAAHCAKDPRARLIAKPNGGVASARNLGIAEGSGRFVAPVDADDLWHPAHLERLLAAALETVPRPALVFALSRHIDTDANVLWTPPPVHVAGRAICRMAFCNLVGNGSALLIDRDAALAVGGYDAGLRAWGAEGCEDYLLQLNIAARYPIASLPAYLVGYRQLPDAMSKNVERMFVSQVRAEALFRSAHAGLAIPARAWRWNRASSALTLCRNRARRGRLLGTMASLARAFAGDPAGTALAILDHALLVIQRACGRVSRKRNYARFETYDASTAHGSMLMPAHELPWSRRLRENRMAWLESVDRALTRSPAA